MMKTILKLAAAALAMSFGQAWAFHDGGVAECGGCHTMHGAATNNTSGLLAKRDPSSTCLACHEHAGDTGPSSYHVSTAAVDLSANSAPKQRSPGGDFAWLKRQYTGAPEMGQQHGHSIVAIDNGYVADTSNLTAPGGTMSSGQFACNDCHDQHGQLRRQAGDVYVRGGVIGQNVLPIANSGSYDNSLVPVANKFAVGVYRLLRGLGDTGSHSGVNYGANTLFVAVAPATYNRSESITQTRVAYGVYGTTGSGAWCATCHPDIHSNAATVGAFNHPVDAGLDGLAPNYNAYVSSGNLTGSNATAFSSLTPFMENQTSYTTLASHAKNNDTFLTGPTTSDQVSCMTCHRAHATGFNHMVRWNPEYEMITSADAALNAVYFGTDTTPGARGNQGRTSAEVQAAYYDRPASKFGIYQRSLCNKCHAKD
jgi:hypothetical protein